MIPKSFLFNNVRVKHVPWHGQDVHPVSGIAFYVNSGYGGVIGVRLYPDGHKELCNAPPCKHEHSNKNYCRGQRPYLQFRHPWNTDEAILASHAVHLAWVGPIEEGMTIDHIDGCTTNNDYSNLRSVSNAVNNRDGGFARKLRNKGINTARIGRAYLLRYFDRMAKFKESHTKTEYRNLAKTDLKHILYDN